MHELPRIPRRIPALLAALLLASTTIAGPANAQFPPEHADLLSGGAYRLLFGLNATPAEEPDETADQAYGDTTAGPPPRVGPNVRVNAPQLPFPDGFLGRSETTLAAVAAGQRLVVGWNDAEGFCGPPFNFGCSAPEIPGASGFGVSTDGGRTFRDLGAPPPGTRIGIGPGPAGTSDSGVYVTGTDPSLDSPHGSEEVWFANLAFFDDFTGNTAGVSTHRGAFGADGSFAWDEPVLLQSPNYPDDFLDKEHVATEHRDGRTSIFVTLTNFIEVAGLPRFGLGQIESFASPDGGETWTRSVIQPDETFPGAPGTGVINQGSEPVVDPDGVVHVAWQRGFLSPFFGQGAAGVFPEIRVARSEDGGATWQPAAAGPPGSGINPAGVRVASICSGDVFPPSGYSRNRSNTWPRIAVARSGSHRGRLYVAWQDCRIANGGPMPAPMGPEDAFGFDIGHPDTDVFLAFSDDGGATWSEPVLVAGGGDGLLQFWPTISVGPTGAVDVTYSESFEPDGTTFQGRGGGTSLVDVFWARSTDGGETFGEPVRLTEVTSDWGATESDLTPNFGDYNDAASVGTSLLATWADGRNGVPDVFFTRALEDQGDR